MTSIGPEIFISRLREGLNFELLRSNSDTGILDQTKCIQLDWLKILEGTYTINHLVTHLFVMNVFLIFLILLQKYFTEIKYI